MKHLQPAVSFLKVATLGTACLAGTAFVQSNAYAFTDSAEKAHGGAALEVKQSDTEISIHQNGKLVTTYQYRSGSKPIFWPILGPEGQSFTRDYPMVPDSKDEKHDHPHHRGLWMNFGDINGHDLWAEGKGKGYICQPVAPKVSSAEGKVTITAEHVWRGGIKDVSSLSETIDAGCDSTSEELAKCKAVYVIAADTSTRTIDCYYEITATTDLHFGDTKEGMFAIRVPESMKVDNKVGRILNSEGIKDGATWGLPARWVDYSGPTKVGEQSTHGIAILVHPESFQAAGRWHVRTYGLFAHNAFGAADFPTITDANKPKDPGLQTPPRAGGYKLAKGESIRFAYRVIFHPGAFTLQQGNEAFDNFSRAELPF